MVVKSKGIPQNPLNSGLGIIGQFAQNSWVFLGIGTFEKNGPIL